ncbi:sensor histidine kinase [Rhodobacteraceae bacterium NNCM2]|nr:sensor histidine kinase [Coraliihabitans acroporae]
MNVRGSLRRRLFIIILTPLCIVALIAALVRYRMAEETSQRLSDETLLAVALVVSRDVVLSEGDLLTEDLLESLTSALGDQIFYHVRGPGGDFVTGYANPPVLPGLAPAEIDEPVFFDSSHYGAPTRVVALREFIQEPTFGGWVTVTVWQTIRRRDELSLLLATRGIIMIVVIIVVAALVVWFGVRWGLKPLADLRRSVARRSPDDLTPIRSPVPKETQSLVMAMNQLFDRLLRAFQERDALISDAAHQLRNPIAAIQAQAEAAASARDEASLRSRTREVAGAARRVSRLTTQLLSMEKAKGRGSALFTPVDLAELARGVTMARAPDALRRGVDLSFSVKGEPLSLRGDPVMLAEAIENLVDNALRYGGGAPVRVSLCFEGNEARLRVEDDGPGVPEEMRETIFQRFRRGEDNTVDGCGLGLAITREVAESHGGTAICQEVACGAAFELHLPCAHTPKPE